MTMGGQSLKSGDYIDLSKDYNARMLFPSAVERVAKCVHNGVYELLGAGERSRENIKKRVAAFCSRELSYLKIESEAAATQRVREMADREINLVLSGY